MTSPTQGPWTYNRLGNIRSPKHVLAQMPPNLYFAEGMTEAEIDANGYLMAAARETTAALQVLLHRYVTLASSGDCGFWDPETEPEVIAARAALAKADNLK